MLGTRADQAYAPRSVYRGHRLRSASLRHRSVRGIAGAHGELCRIKPCHRAVSRPVGALLRKAQPWQSALFTAITANFIPLLAPTNPMNYDPVLFYNAALAIVVGVARRRYRFACCLRSPPAIVPHDCWR